MKKEGIILIGGGGHCRSVIDVITLGDQFEIIGILDRPDLVGEKVLGYEMIGTDDDIPKFAQSVGNFIVTIGQIKDNSKRKNAFARVEQAGGKLKTIISPKAHVSAYAQIGAGTLVGHNAVVNAGARVGVNCILNSNCLIEHDSIIGDNCHISTTAVVNGECRIGQDSFVGSGAMIANNVNIGTRCIIGASSAILQDMEDDLIVTGPRSTQIRKR